MELVNINVGIFILVEIQGRIGKQKKSRNKHSKPASVDALWTRKEILNEIFF